MRPDSDEDVTITLPAGAVTTEAGSKLANAVSATVAGPGPPPPAPPLTASFGGLPAEHDGQSLFSFELAFSEDFPGRLNYRTLRDGAFVVDNGRVRGAARVAQGQNRRWTITVRPASAGDVTITLPSGSVSTEAGRPLENTASATVSGPPLLSVGDAEAREGEDENVVFQVALSRAASGTVTARYATRDGTATAGEDYTAVSGTLEFAAGETAKAVAVPLLDDAIDDDGETFALVLSNPSGGAIGDGEGTATIRNTDPLPAAWLVRFGRAAADHAVDAVESRFDARGAASHATFAGRRLWSGGQKKPRRRRRREGLGPFDRLDGGFGNAPGSGLHGVAGGASAGVDDSTLHDLLAGSSFFYSNGGEGEDDTGGRRGFTAWGRGSSTRFDGVDGDVSVDGDVATYFLGVDVERRHLLAGVALAHSGGSGGFAAETAGFRSGSLDSTLTAVHPYLRWQASDRISLWGVLGYGAGTLDMTADGSNGGWTTDTDMRMAAGGMRGVFARASGFELAAKMDARIARTTSDAAASEGGLLGAVSGDASRLRLALEGSRTVAFGDTRTFTPTLEVGVRQDGGDAETGAGVDLGGSVRYADSAVGLTVEASGRYLAAHEDSDYREWGASATIRLDPGASGRGLSLALVPSAGTAATGGADRLWSLADARGLDGGHRMDAGMRLDADLGYGLGAFSGSGSMRPFMGLRLAGPGRDWRAGVSWTRGENLRFGLQASRLESSMAAPRQGIEARVTLRW